MSKSFTDDEKKFLFALRDAVEQNGANHIYDKSEAGTYVDSAATNCTYVNYRDGGDRPSCLIGRGLYNSGLMGISDLRRHEGSSATIVVPFGENNPVTTAATMMQSAQDDGQTWGYAFYRGLLYLAHHGYDVFNLML